VVLAAAYMLRMLQRIAYGGTNNPKHAGILDLNSREILTLAPLLVFVFWIGLKPAPFTHVMHATVQNLMENVVAGASAGQLNAQNLPAPAQPSNPPQLAAQPTQTR
jgi:NADH-quinone oxidoreductase subunit M